MRLLGRESIKGDDVPTLYKTTKHNAAIHVKTAARLNTLGQDERAKKLWEVEIKFRVKP